MHIKTLLSKKGQIEELCILRIQLYEISKKTNVERQKVD